MKLIPKPYQCDDCDGCYKSLADLTRHVRYKHTHEKPYKCTKCTYAAVERSKLNLHMLSHSGEKPYQCKKCNYACRDRHKLTRHLHTHNKKKRYKCEICNILFTDKDSLNLHSKKLHLECQQDYLRRSDLKSNLRKENTDDKRLTCTKCDERFKNQYSLMNHLKEHKQKRKYKCHFCQFESYSKRHLRKHRQSHDKSLFKCSFCNNSFITKNLLKQHVNVAHNLYKFPKYQCNECGEAYVSKQYLVHHLKCHGELKSEFCKKINKFHKELSNYSPDLLTVAKNLRNGHVIILPEKTGEKFIMIEILRNNEDSNPPKVTKDSKKCTDKRILKEFYVEIEDDRMEIKIEPESDVEISDEEAEPFYGF